MSYLERTGKRENTIVIYGSDHGAYSGTYGIAEKAPGICSEAVCRVPMVWSVPRVTKKGFVSRQLVENIDITPTLVSLCDLPPMDTVDGRDLTPLLKGGDTPVREIAVTENVWSKGLRWGRGGLSTTPRHFSDRMKGNSITWRTIPTRRETFTMIQSHRRSWPRVASVSWIG